MTAAGDLAMETGIIVMGKQGLHQRLLSSQMHMRSDTVNGCSSTIGLQATASRTHGQQRALPKNKAVARMEWKYSFLETAHAFQAPTGGISVQR